MTETDNVATYSRIRPYNPAIKESKILTARAVAGSKILNQNGDREDTYNFTKVFDMTSSNEQVFAESVRPLLDHKVLSGITSIFIVYGQSGSGKSWTLIGEDGTLGVLPLSMQYLLKQDDVERLDLSVIECYGIRSTKIGLFDLVALRKERMAMDDPSRFDAYKMAADSRLSLSNAATVAITEQNSLDIVQSLQSVSHLAPTLKNPHSSRGHTVYFCRVKLVGLETVHFVAVDLAGSEGQTALGSKDEFVDGLQRAMSRGKLKLTKLGTAALSLYFHPFVLSKTLSLRISLKYLLSAFRQETDEVLRDDVQNQVDGSRLHKQYALSLFRSLSLNELQTEK